MSTEQPIRRGRRYRRSIIGLVLVGMVGLLGGMAVDQYLPGLVVYAVAVVAGVGLTLYGCYSPSVTLQDERESELSRRASDVTFRLFGYLGLFAFVALFLLDATGRHEIGSTTQALLNAYAAVALTWGGIYAVLRYRS